MEHTPFLYADILDEICTKEAAQEFAGKLDELQTLVFNVHLDIETKMNEILTAELTQKVRSYCMNHTINIKDPSVFHRFLMDLKEEVKMTPVVTMHLAFHPEDQQVKRMSDWLISQIHKKIFLEIVVKKDLVGGAIIIWNGIYKNYSLEQQLEERYKDKDLLTV